MKNIRVSKNVKARFVEYSSENESVNETFERLFTESRLQVYDSDDGATSIQLSDENLERLKSFRAYSTETYSSVLLRLLDSVKD